MNLGKTGIFLVLFLAFVVPSFGLERNNLVFYLPFEGSINPLIAKGNTEIKLVDFYLPFEGSFKYLADKDKKELKTADVVKKIEFVEGRRGLGLKVKGNPSRSKVYSYPHVQYLSKDSFSHWEGTIAVWIKPIGWSGDGGQRYFIAVYSDTCVLRLYTYPGNTWVWVDGPDRYYLIGGRDWHGWKDGKWTFLAFTFKPGQQKWYINGELKSKQIEKLIEPEFSKTGSVEISEGDHVVDELMIFDRVLTDNEIMAIYKANMPK